MPMYIAISDIFFPTNLITLFISCIAASPYRTPLKKIADARDVATQVVVLASPTLSGHVTGQTLMVEGGMEGRLLNNPEDVELPP